MTALDVIINNYKSTGISALDTQGLCCYEALDCNCVGDDCGQGGGSDCNNCT